MPNSLMKSSGHVRIEINDAAVWITMDRPDRRNAFDARMIGDLTEAITDATSHAATRAVVLSGTSPHFCAGADIEWMLLQGKRVEAENREDAKTLVNLLDRLDRCPKVTIAMIQGAAMGGGLGLVAACDIAIAADDAIFAAPEVRLGLVPATIAPYMVRAIGPRAARRLFLTGRRIDAIEAMGLGLVHEVVPAGDLRKSVLKTLSDIRKGGPGAVADVKDLLKSTVGRAIDPAMLAETAERLVQRRATGEAQAGFRAYLEKRKPPWAEGDS